MATTSGDDLFPEVRNPEGTCVINGRCLVVTDVTATHRSWRWRSGTSGNGRNFRNKTGDFAGKGCLNAFTVPNSGDCGVEEGGLFGGWATLKVLVYMNTQNTTPTENLEDSKAIAEIEKATISQMVDNAKSAVAATLESQRLAAAGMVDVLAKHAEIQSIAAQAVAARTQIVDAQGVIATKSDHIQKAQEHADRVRADLDRALTAATQQATAAEAHKANAQSAADRSAALLADFRTAKGAAETESAAIAEARKVAEESAAATKGLADKSGAVETRIASYEKRLSDFDTWCVQQQRTIETLLRGATSAGLAHSFDARRQTFLKPLGRWQQLFVGSVVALVVLAVSGWWQVHHFTPVPTWGEWARLWLARLPAAGALIWLALHASRESALAKRLEEDYGYKAAIAACFEGFRKEMSEIGSSVAPNSPLAKLCGDTLTTIATPPGRIYDRHRLVVSPTGELTEVAKAGAQVVKEVVNAPRNGH
jgi:hypothetical protein